MNPSTSEATGEQAAAEDTYAGGSVSTYLFLRNYYHQIFYFKFNIDFLIRYAPSGRFEQYCKLGFINVVCEQ